MAYDWQPGDLALYAPPRNTPSSAYRVKGPGLRRGAVYTVERVVNWFGILGLGIEVSSPHPSGLWHHAGFKKIRPHTPDAEDAETIRLLNGKPAKVPA